MTVTVSFQPEGKIVEVPVGSTVYDAALQAGITFDAPCGGHGSCGKCRVHVVRGAGNPNPVEEKHLTADDLAKGFRLACQTPVTAAMTVECLNGLGQEHKILVDAALPIDEACEPSVVKHFVQLPKPTLDEDAPDLQRLQQAIGVFNPALAVLQRLPKRLRDAGFAGTAVLVDGRLLDFESGNTESAAFSVAFDIGTTTLAGVLVDAVTGEVRARVSRMNPQTRFGDDVLSRIQVTIESPDGLSTLQRQVMTAVNQMLQELTASAGVSPEHIYEATFSGNTTMQCLLTGVDPAALGQVPFAPPTAHAVRCNARELDLAIHPNGCAYVFPVIGGFVGGDTVAGLLVTRLAESQKPALFLDIGTNGEIVIHHDGRLVAASCAAGPAFEGARIAHGMRATTGAIEEVVFKDDVELRVIGNVPPSGLCGSALLDVAAELLRHGILDPSGLFNPPEALENALPPAIRARLVSGEDGLEFVLSPAGQGANGRAIVVTQADIRQLQLATAAIRAGIAILLRQTGLSAADLGQFVIAGGFGNYIRPHNAQRIGLLPPDVAPERFSFAGNTSLAGARLAAVSLKARQRAQELAQRTEHVDLSLDLNFQTEYVEAMFFPMD